MTTQRDHGFTLIELIVASTLMALVLSGVYLTFSTAVRSWRQGEANYATYEDARRALGLLDRELHAIPADAIHLMIGTRDSLEFVTLAQPLDVETASSERLLRVQYRFKGDRSGGVKDPSGNQWWIGTHIEDVTVADVERRYSEMKQQQAAAAGL